MRKTIFVLAASAITSCSTYKQLSIQSSETVKELKYLHTYTLPFNLQYKETTVGGLSSIDYDEKTDSYFLVCDDRSSINPARYYAAKIKIGEKKIDTIVFTNRYFLLDQIGKVYPGNKQNPLRVPDPESMRYIPSGRNLVWSSEGERLFRAKDTILNHPAIHLINKAGMWKDSFRMPENLMMSALEKGPRQNGVLEGLSFTHDYKYLLTCVEEPLHEDGPRAAPERNQAMIRFFEFDTKTKKSTRQFAYELDPVAHKPNPANAYYVNGVPEFLYIGNDQLLVLERSYSTGRIPCTIKIFLADYQRATDVSSLASLKNNGAYQPMKKTLLLNMDQLGIFTDNIEGITLGPVLPNGNRSVMLVSDNNFSPTQQSQFMLLELITVKKEK